MDLLKFLSKNVKPATGCTEPIAVGYAVSLAYHALFNDLPKEFGKPYSAPDYKNLGLISVKTDRDVYKNALAIKIPNTNGQKGIAIAAAMGLYADPRKELNLFDGISQEAIENANIILSKKKVFIEDVEDDNAKSDLDIEVSLEYKVNNIPRHSYVRLQHEHNNISEIRVDNKIVYRNGTYRKKQTQDEIIPDSIDDIINIVKNATPEEKREAYKGVEMNRKIAEYGLTYDYGLGIGKKLNELLKQGIIDNSIITKVKIMAAAAGDARMGGANMPVMSTSGSGNQGITALIPVYVVGTEYNIDKEKISEAALLSHIITKKISNYSGYLSAICGCAIKAGIGATAAVSYLLGGSPKQINNAINMMAANLTGMVCDGAKEGCSLKLSTAAATATESAFLALSNIEVPKDNGIISQDSIQTMKNIGKITKEMVRTDLKIVDIMQHKGSRKKHPHLEDPFGERLMINSYALKMQK